MVQLGMNSQLFDISVLSRNFPNRFQSQFKLSYQATGTQNVDWSKAYHTQLL